jgi:hypothetical protein
VWIVGLPRRSPEPDVSASPRTACVRHTQWVATTGLSSAGVLVFEFGRAERKQQGRVTATKMTDPSAHARLDGEGSWDWV